MAVVRITEDLKRQVLVNARMVFVPRIDAHEKTHPLRNDPAKMERVFYAAYDASFGVYKEHMEALPKKIFAETTQLCLNRWGSVDCKNLSVVSDTPVMCFGLSYRPEGCPLKYSTFNSTLSIFGSEPPDDILEIIKACATHTERRSLLSVQQDDFVNGVRGLLDSHTTLGPAIKVMPALWELLPDWAKNKHKEKVKRPARKTSDDAPPIDVASLTAAIARNKIMGE